ncbi:uncharacterized protein LOC117104472 [Anneissia japonica]|uniref:uncharacterized protein LOC117104472 n=1 Tax=Anneissia japonica TaxID=1529436 RepID=UPI001425909E|nr:uncharacterized protein LOC117104472 [Anneissia japonica]
MVLDFFITDEEVSNFVNSYNDSTTGFKECNQFKAGDKVRSKSRTSKMDVTGVFGSVCRHESPVLFMNMQHGERLVYSVLLLDKLLNVPASKDQKLNETYDIACVLFSHLNVEFNPRRTTGFGLTDGEGIERLWSYLRCFAKITKEMTPSHRVDLLTDALLHYAKRKERNIGKHSKAVSILKNTEKEIGDKISLINKVITEETIQEWKIEEKATLCSKAKPVKATWEEIYVEQLQRLNSLSECIQEDKDPDLIEQYTRLQKFVACLEKAKGISKRWHKDEVKYISANDVLQRRCQKNILDKMREGAQERMFLLDLKKKYYDGQAVAKRFCGQVNRSS